MADRLSIPLQFAQIYFVDQRSQRLRRLRDNGLEPQEDGEGEGERPWDDYASLIATELDERNIWDEVESCGADVGSLKGTRRRVIARFRPSRQGPPGEPARFDGMDTEIVELIAWPWDDNYPRRIVPASELTNAHGSHGFIAVAIVKDWDLVNFDPWVHINDSTEWADIYRRIWVAIKYQLDEMEDVNPLDDEGYRPDNEEPRGIYRLGYGAEDFSPDPPPYSETDHLLADEPDRQAHSMMRTLGTRSRDDTGGEREHQTTEGLRSETRMSDANTSETVRYDCVMS